MLIDVQANEIKGQNSDLLKFIFTYFCANLTLSDHSAPARAPLKKLWLQGLGSSYMEPKYSGINCCELVGAHHKYKTKTKPILKHEI